jgi:capsular polysaccharide export protein
LDRLLNRKGIFYGWGRKDSGLYAIDSSITFKTSFRLLEDGFIRSVGLGIDASPSFSIVEDDVGIYYDATVPSRLENILNTYDFTANSILMKTAHTAMDLIRKHRISKYNNTQDIAADIFENNGQKRILIIAQTAGDESLRYGMTDHFSTEMMIQAAIKENPNAEIYLKIHPDVLSGKKSSDIDIEIARQHCIIIDQNVNPLSLLEYFDTVYTKTSQMGFEALLLGKNCVCFGMPFYAGWGLTDDRVQCSRRVRKRTVEEVFASAYILYTHYFNPYQKRSSDIIDTIHEIVRQRRIQNNRPSQDKRHRVLAIGDSHIRVFEHWLFNLFFPKTKFNVVYVPGASVSGIRNVNSLSGAYTTFNTALEEGGYDEIVITLGEVDAAYAIWIRLTKGNMSLETIFEDIVSKYQDFILYLTGYAPLTVISAPLQTIDDCQECSDETSLVRSSIDINIENRNRFTLQFNSMIKSFCNDHKIKFVDMDTVVVRRDNLVKRWLINPKNKCDHHYWRWIYALLLIWKLKIGKMN